MKPRIKLAFDINEESNKNRGVQIATVSLQIINGKSFANFNDEILSSKSRV